MKIAHIISTFPPYKGGMGNSARQFALEIARLGHDVTVFTPACDNKLPRHERLAPGVELLRLPILFSIGNGSVMPSVMKHLKKFDVVHLHYPFYGGAEYVMTYLVFRRLFFRRPKLVVHYHMDTVSGGLKGVIFRLYRLTVLPILIRLADLVTCASSDYIKHSHLQDYYKAQPQKFLQVPFGVDTNHFSLPKEKDETVKEIVFVGGMDKQHNFKGIPELISAFARVKKDYPEARLTLIGRGDRKVDYLSLAETFELGDSLVIRDDIVNSELPHFYAKATVSVLPSINRAEAFGLVLLEAMACGTPVIAANLPGVRSVFRNNEHGWLVQPGNIDDLAAKLKNALKDTVLTASLGRKARAWVEEEYSWQKVGQELEAAYYRALNVPKPLPPKAEEDIFDEDED